MFCHESISEVRYRCGMISSGLQTLLQLMPGVGWSDVKRAVTGLWSSGYVFCGVIIQISLSGSLMDDSGFWQIPGER